MQHVCQNCDEPFESPYRTAKFCSRPCVDKHLSASRTIDRVCRLCNGELVKPGQIKLRYCSPECRDSDPNRIVIDGIVHTSCLHCEKDFTHPNWRTLDYCSKPCADESRRTIYMVDAQCLICNEHFSYRSCEKNRRFCSRPCWHKFETGEGSSCWSSVKVKCEHCGEPMTRQPNRIERAEHDFCSPKCKGLFYAKIYVGENHPLWKGGAYSNRGKGWYTQRHKAWERDNYTCQHCGKTKKQIGKNPDVHHIVPFSHYGLDQAELANRLENLVCLCHDCHMKAEHNLIPIQPYLI